MSAVLPVLVIVPLVTALAIALFARGSERVADVLCNVGTVVVVGLVFVIAGPVLGGTTLAWFMGGASPLGVNLGVDALSLLMLLALYRGPSWD